MDIEFEDLKFQPATGLLPWRRKEKLLLKSVNGCFRAGELSGILGPSGAGKTSLLNAISGYRSGGVSGNLLTNGQPRDPYKFRKTSCYITQEDLLLPLLSVNEVMWFAASLKLPTSYSGKQKMSVVSEVQDMLGLDECKYTRTERLSGGQRKRLSVALELINNPPVLFLDEPTSGLDTVSMSNLLKILRSLAHQGRTIVCTIHQPSALAFKMFDHVYVIAAGLCVYQGPSHELVPFLDQQGLKCPTTYNPADFVIELTEDSKNVEKLSKAVKNGKISIPNKKRHRVEPIEIERDSSLFVYGRFYDDGKEKGTCSELSPNSWTQFCTLMARMFLQMKRNKACWQLQLWNHLGCGLALGGMFYQMARDGNEFFNHMKFCICVILFHTFTQCMIPILAYPFEVKLLKKEHFNQWYGLWPYYMALTFSTFPLIAACSLIYLTIVYALSGLPYELERFLVFCLIGTTVAFAAQGMGLFIGSVFSITNGAAVGPLSIAPFLGLAIYGFDFARSIPPFMDLIASASFMRAGVIALVITVFGLNRAPLDCADVYCHFQDPKYTMYYLNLEGATPYKEIFNLFIMTLCFRLSLYLGLKWRLRT